MKALHYSTVSKLINQSSVQHVTLSYPNASVTTEAALEDLHTGYGLYCIPNYRVVIIAIQRLLKRAMSRVMVQ